MSQTTLESEQRDDLLALLERRLTKLDDDVLMELERLTRNPQELGGFVAYAKVEPNAGAPMAQQPPPAVPTKPAGPGISRRQLLGITAWTFVTAAATCGGGYLVGNLQGDQCEAQYAQLDSAIRSASEQFDETLAALGEKGLSAADAARTMRDMGNDFLDSYGPIVTALHFWRNSTGQVANDYQSLRLVREGVGIAADLLAALASIPAVSAKILDGLVDINVMSLSEISQALLSVGDLLDHLDGALGSAGMLDQQLTLWFSGADDADIKRQLLSPLLDEFCPEVLALGAQCQYLEQDWQQQLVEPVNAARPQLTPAAG